MGEEAIWEDPECHFRDNQSIRYCKSTSRVPTRSLTMSKVAQNGIEQESTIRVYYTVPDVKFYPLQFVANNRTQVK